MLSQQARMVAYAMAAAYAALGAILFVAPNWSSEHFAWRVSPFVAITIGGWCLGNACAAFVIARRWVFPLVMATMSYFISFGVLETAVVIAFHDRLRLDQWLGWLYLAALAINIVVAIAWAKDYFVLRPTCTPSGRMFRPVDMAIGLPLQLYVVFLGCYGLFAPPGSPGINGGVFPEVLSPFSLRAFGAFYLSVAVGLVPVLVARGIDNTMSHLFASWPLIFFITLAAFVYIDKFDFVNRPGQMLYIGTYLLVAVITGGYLVKNGTGAELRPSYVA
jgi:hypothetical protein